MLNDNFNFHIFITIPNPNLPNFRFHDRFNNWNKAGPQVYPICTNSSNHPPWFLPGSKRHLSWRMATAAQKEVTDKIRASSILQPKELLFLFPIPIIFDGLSKRMHLIHPPILVIVKISRKIFLSPIWPNCRPWPNDYWQHQVQQRLSLALPTVYNYIFPPTLNTPASPILYKLVGKLMV